MDNFLLKYPESVDTAQPVKNFSSVLLEGTLEGFMNHRFIQILGFFSGMIAVSALSAEDRDPYRAARRQMVDQEIVAEGIKNERVLDAMRTVQRHLYVKPTDRDKAYIDTALDIGYKQTISPPFVVAYMTEVLDPQPTDRVLEIGTGSGYQASVLAGLVKDVYTIEIVEPLGLKAAELIRSQRLHNVHTKIGDGYLGWEEFAPFDKIIVTCSPESIPEPLVKQLADGGKMIIPLGERYQQVFHLLEKKGDHLERTKLLPTLFVPMTGKSEDQREILPDATHPLIVNGGFEELGEQPGFAKGWHYQRRTKLLKDTPFQGERYLRIENEIFGRSADIRQAWAIDGAKVTELTFTVSYRARNLRPNPTSKKYACVTLYPYDGKRIPLTPIVVTQWRDDVPEWKTSTHTIAVPPTAREAILQIGLSDGTGTLDLDNLSLTAKGKR